MSPEGFKENSREYPPHIAEALRELLNKGNIDASEDFVFGIKDEEARSLIIEVVEKLLQEQESGDTDPEKEKEAAAEINEIIDRLG